MIDTVKGFSVVNEAEVDVFLDVGTSVSGSSVFSKSSLYIWMFSIQRTVDT